MLKNRDFFAQMLLNIRTLHTLHLLTRIWYLCKRTLNMRIVWDFGLETD